MSPFTRSEMAVHRKAWSPPSAGSWGRKPQKSRCTLSVHARQTRSPNSKEVFFYREDQCITVSESFTTVWLFSHFKKIFVNNYLKLTSASLSVTFPSLFHQKELPLVHGISTSSFHCSGQLRLRLQQQAVQLNRNRPADEKSRRSGCSAPTTYAGKKGCAGLALA